ncbi:hypothetical protein Fot_19989 [Forsythia ovata]|uniref:Uncharacterized protein n=1 Tax=Forsythia ovata TaxID=205694 RepID=A0ABD1VP96_9LAMI
MSGTGKVVKHLEMSTIYLHLEVAQGNKILKQDECPQGHGAHEGSLRRIEGSNPCSTWKATFFVERQHLMLEGNNYVGRQWSIGRRTVECPAQVYISCDHIRIYLSGEPGGKAATLQD